jgi:hypothetical protein
MRSIPPVGPVIGRRLETGGVVNAQRMHIAASVFLLGLLVALVGLMGSFSDGDDPYHIECDGKPMTYGDRCISFGGGKNGTYEELVASERSSIERGRTIFPLVATVGIVLVIGSVVVAGSAILREPKPPDRQPSGKPVDRNWWTEGGGRDGGASA